MISIRREGPAYYSPIQYGYNLNELRIYQTPNLMMLLDVKISAPSPKAPEYIATNLITNLESRTSGNNKFPFIDSLGNKANFKSCFKTTDAELSADGDKMVITIDLG